MKVKLIRASFVAGQFLEPDPKKDGIVDVGDSEGRNLIAGGKALPVAEADEAAPENRAETGRGNSTRQA